MRPTSLAVILLSSVCLACGQGQATATKLPSAPDCAGMACVTEFTIPTHGGGFGTPPQAGDSIPHGIVAGKDGALWFHEGPAGRIGRLTVDGKCSEFPIPGAPAAASSQGFMGAASDGSIWFTVDPPANLIGRIMAGKVTTYPIPTPAARARAVVPTADGAIWFTEAGTGMVGRLGPDRTFREYPLPAGPASNPLGMAMGPDGALWVVEGGAARIARVTLDGTIREFDLPDRKASALRIIAGPDRAMWFNEFGADRIGRIGMDGQITEFSLTPGTGPVSGAVGGDGALYWTSLKGDKVLRVTTAGASTQWWPTPSLRSGPYHIAAGRDGALWFTEHDANRIGRLQLFGSPAASHAGAARPAGSASPVPGGSMAGPAMSLPPPPPAGAPIGTYGKTLQSSNGYNQGRWRFDLFPDGSCKFTYLEPGGTVMTCVFVVTADTLLFPGDGSAACPDGAYHLGLSGPEMTLSPVRPDPCGGLDHGRQQVVATGSWTKQ